MPGSLAPILRVLDRAAAEGPPVRVWWRDDDAAAATPSLDRLLALARDVGAPLAIAAIPARAEPSLPARLAGLGSVSVLVHGWSHADHAPAGEKAAEFGPHRPLAVMEAELERGLALTRRLFAGQALPIFVPPWNRIGAASTALLPALGYAALSTFSSGRPSPAGAGIPRLDTHLDPVDWRGGRRALSPSALADALARGLQGPGRTVGLLTHHLAFDEALWTLTRELVEGFARHPGVRFVRLSTLLDEEPSSSSARLLQGGQGTPSRRSCAEPVT